MPESGAGSVVETVALTRCVCQCMCVCVWGGGGGGGCVRACVRVCVCVVQEFPTVSLDFYPEAVFNRGPSAYQPYR